MFLFFLPETKKRGIKMIQESNRQKQRCCTFSQTVDIPDWPIDFLNPNELELFHYIGNTRTPGEVDSRVIEQIRQAHFIPGAQTTLKTGFFFNQGSTGILQIKSLTSIYMLMKGVLIQRVYLVHQVIKQQEVIT